MRRPLALLLLLAACAAPRKAPQPPPSEQPTKAAGDEIVACGRRFPADTRVVLWSDPRGFDAYLERCFFDRQSVNPSGGEKSARRYGRRKNLLDGEITLDRLRSVVRQIVIHYDAAGSSERCFRVLHDVRGLSCHFLLDVDGTIYQTLDLRERAFHASEANDISVGIEIANAGAYPAVADLRRARSVSETPMVHGVIQGTTLYQYEFTDAQYEALGRLLRALCRVFPGVERRFPSADRAIPRPLEFSGIVGHYHLTKAKQDPGPAFDWGRIASALAADGVE